jgi:hypothetical protein
MKAPDRDKFIEAVHKEFGAMIDSEIVEVFLSEVTEGAKRFPAVWA